MTLMPFHIYRGFAKDWPALHNWTPDYFIERIGAASPVEIMAGRNGDPDYEPGMDKHKMRVPLKYYLDVCQREVTNDKYMVANNFFWNQYGTKIIQDILPPLPRAMFWMGPCGTVTPLHRDPVDVLHVQIVGQKRWRLIAPHEGELDTLYAPNGIHSAVDIENYNESKYPRFMHAPGWDEVTLNPGDAIFTPTGWWHHVRGLTPTISLGFAD
jgi:hypothetical protein